MVDNIMFVLNEKLLKSVPMFEHGVSDTVLKTLSTKMYHEIYLPGDHVFYRNDTGEEMYFIIEGGVNFMSTNGKRIVGVLRKGSYFGEEALVECTLRSRSVMTNSFSLFYVMTKSDFESSLSEY